MPGDLPSRLIQSAIFLLFIYGIFMKNKRISDSDNEDQRNAWLAVLSLAIGAFSSVTSEFIPVGILPDVARDFDITTGKAGLMMTVPGLLAAISAPAVLIVAGKIDRKKLLVTLSLLQLISAFISAFSMDWSMMLIGRAISGISLGAFWALSLTVAGNLVPAMKAASAIATVFSGVTIAMIFGVPLGTFVAEYAGWRAAFIAAALIATIALTIQCYFLPSIPARQSMRISSLVKFLRLESASKSLLMIFLVYVTHFGTYTFLASLLAEVGASPQLTSWTLLGFGVTGFIGNSFAPRYIRKNLSTTMSFGLALLSASLIACIFAQQPVFMITAVLVWGIAWGVVPLTLNINNRLASGHEVEAGSAMFTFTAQVSIAMGSGAGGVVVDWVGIRADFMAGVSIIILSLLTLRFWQVPKQNTQDTVR